MMRSYAFVTPAENIGAVDAIDKIIYQSADPPHLRLECKGSLQQWKENVASLAIGNSRLVLAISASFAAPTLYLVKDPSTGIHLQGSSSIGKTTGLTLAASVYASSSYILPWRATINGIEGTAAQYNDLLLPLDEMGQSSPEEAAQVAYMLMNGMGKQRADRSGSARRPIRWRLVLLSSGETSLATHLQKIGKTTMAGQQVRIIDIPGDAGAGLGIFEYLHGEEDGDKLARKLKAVANRYYGTAGREWIEYLAANFEEVAEILRCTKRKFVEHLILPQACSGQVRRVADCFALFAAAGELATERGITGWPNGQAFDAAKICFKAWLESRGGTGDYEREKLILQVRMFFEQHGESRFTPWSVHHESAPGESKTISRAGFKREEADGLTYYVLPEVFRSELCKGFELKLAKKVLADAGFLKLGDDGQTAPVTLPGMGSVRAFQITSKVFSA